MKKNTKLIIVGVILVFLLLFLSFKHPKNSEEIVGKSFKINTILLKVAIKQGEVFKTEFIITNFDESQKFNLSFENSPGVIFLDSSNFMLVAGEKKKIKVTFDGSKGISPGIYPCFLIIETTKEKQRIPIILEIYSKNQQFVTILYTTPKYKEIPPGGEIVTEAKIFNLKDNKPHSLTATFLVKNFEGENIILEKENFVVQSEGSVSKNIHLKNDLPLGNYVVGVITKYDGQISTSSHLIEIVYNKTSFWDNLDNLMIILFIVIFSFLILIAVMFFYFMRQRDKLFIELRKQHRKEMHFFMKELQELKKKKLEKAKNAREKKKIIHEFRKKRKVVAKHIKEKQREREIIFKKLKKENKRHEMKRKLAQWKKEGFNIKELDAIFKKEGRKTRNLKSLKKKGFDVDALS